MHTVASAAHIALVVSDKSLASAIAERIATVAFLRCIISEHLYCRIRKELTSAYSTPAYWKPLLAQNEAHTARVILAAVVVALVRARPLVPSAMHPTLDHPLGRAETAGTNEGVV